MDTLTQILLCFATAAIGWTFSKLKTNREKKESDLNLVNNSVTPLVESIKKLTEQNNELVGKLTAEQDVSLRLIKEKGELLEKIEQLEREISDLRKQINKLIRKTNEKNNTDNNGNSVSN
jgi:chromosome segregation ATPase